MKLSHMNKGWVLFFIVLIVNILQSVFTPLLNDEAYYWLYAQHPAWGYLDHPPMVALLINVGKAILPGEIGIRLIGAIIGSLTFLLIYKIIESESKKPVDYKLVTLLLLSSVFLNAYSFLAIPDTPMLFFAVLFLYCYRKYVNRDSILNAAILGMVTASLLYSKYHGVLLVGFTLISNPGLVLKRSFYIALFLALLLYTPHLYWQFQNDFPTVRFQFFQRAGEFEIGNLLSYLGEQAAVTGPIILLAFSLLYRSENQFQKTLKYIVAGVFLFFFISSFKEMVNMHWTAIAFPAMLCLAYLYINELKTNKQLVTGILIFNLCAVIFFRINFVGNFFQLSNFNDKNPRKLTSLLKAKSKGYPLVFENMYNEPSYFMFYGGNDSYAINDISYKKTQFNYLPGLESKFRGKTVGLVTMGAINKTSEKIKIPEGKTYYLTTIPDFTSYSTAITINASDLSVLTASAQTSIDITVQNTLTNHDKLLINDQAPYLQLTLINNESKQSYSYKNPFTITEKTANRFTFKAPPEKGDYTGIFSFMTGNSIYAGFNSNVYKVMVE